MEITTHLRPAQGLAPSTGSASDRLHPALSLPSLIKASRGRKGCPGLESLSLGTLASVEIHRPEGGGQQERIWVGMVFKELVTTGVVTDECPDA